MKWGCLVLALVAACGGDDVVFVDAPRIDAAEVDAPTDAPPIDAPDVDAPPIDAPPIDAPPIDAPVVDAPPIDAPPIDAPVIDAPPPIDAPVIDATPPIDAPEIDAPPIDAPIDAPPGNLVSFTVRNAGSGAGVLDVGLPSGNRNCWAATCTYQVPVGSTISTVINGILAESTVLGWSTPPCTGFAFCTVTVDAPTTIAMSWTGGGPNVWIRSALTDAYRRPLALDITPSGILVVGYADTADHAVWIAHYTDIGAHGEEFFFNNTGVSDQAFDVAVDASGWFYILMRVGTNTFLRRYSSAGIAQWSVAVPNAMELAADAAGNAYVAAGDVISYGPNGAERWRHTPPGAARAVWVRGNQVAAGGHGSPGKGWIGMFNLAGALSWSDEVDVSSPGDCYVDDVAITSTGAIVYGRLDTHDAPATYALGSATATMPPPVTAGGVGSYGSQLALDENNAPVAWIFEGAGLGTTKVGGADVTIDDSYVEPGGIAYDAIGNLYMSGIHQDFNATMVLRQ